MQNIHARGTGLAVSFVFVLAWSIARCAFGDVVTNINISSYYNHPWSTAINGGPIAAAPVTGDTGTGLTFANFNGNFVYVGADGGGSPINLTFTPVALTATSP